MSRKHPARMVACSFLLVIGIGTAVLMLPISSAAGKPTPLVDALFTATSAISMTGLVVVDTGSHWSFVGQAVVLALIQTGGFGVMACASVVVLVLGRRLSLRWQVSAAAEGRVLQPASVRHVVLASLGFTALVEVSVAIILSLRFILHYHVGVARGVWEGVFHSISAFNNAGFGLYRDSLMSFLGDPLIILPIAFAIVVGGLGFPVLIEMVHLRRRLSANAMMTLVGTCVLLLAGMLLIGVAEWHHALAPLTWQERTLGIIFQAVTPRTAGFNSLDYSTFQPITLMGTDVLMFIGGGSAGTAGGVKITTLIVFAAAIIAHLRGEQDVVIARRRMTVGTIRQSITIMGIGAALIVFTVALIRVTDPQFTGDQVWFEVLSAFGTVGLSTGITAGLSTPAHLALCLTMYLGRIGPLTLLTALVLRERTRLYTFPLERTFVG